MRGKKTILTGSVLALAVAAVATGLAIRTKGPALASQVVLKGHHLYLLDTTLGEKRLPAAGDVELLFDQEGDRVLYGVGWEGSHPDSEDAGGTRLRVMRADGTDDRPVADDLVRQAFFSRDGRTIWYVTRDQGLYAIGVDGSDRRKVQEKVLSPSLSPDGRRLAYQKLNADWQPGEEYDRALGLTVLDVASGEEKRVSASWEDFNPIWTPDGRKILFFSRSPEGMASHFIMDADGGNRRQLTNIGQLAVTDKTVPVPSEAPAWSPDGRHLIYEADREIWVNEFTPAMDGIAGARSIGYGKHPEWSPDGKSVRVLVGKDGDPGSWSGAGFEGGSLVTIGLDGKIQNR